MTADEEEDDDDEAEEEEDVDDDEEEDDEAEAEDEDDEEVHLLCLYIKMSYFFELFQLLLFLLFDRWMVRPRAIPIKFPLSPLNRAFNSNLSRVLNSPPSLLS